MKATLVLGGLGYVAARWIFDASNHKAFWWGVGLGALGYIIANQKPAVFNPDTPQLTTPTDQTDPLGVGQKPFDNSPATV